MEKLREARGYPSLNQTDEELEALDGQILRIPLAKEKIDAIVASVLSSAPPKHRRPALKQTADSEADSTELEEEIVALHRNEGDSDPDVEQRLRELREDALSEDLERDDE